MNENYFLHKTHCEIILLLKVASPSSFTKELGIAPSKLTSFQKRSYYNLVDIKLREFYSFTVIMSQEKKTYPKEFKLMIVELNNKRTDLAELANELDIKLS